MYIGNVTITTYVNNNKSLKLLKNILAILHRELIVEKIGDQAVTRNSFFSTKFY